MLRRLDVRTVARPVLERLNAELEETIHLGRLEGGDVHFVESIESRRALRVGSRLGRSMPAHCTSTGKVLLAQLTENELLRLYPNEELIQLTPESIDTRSELLKALADVQACGYASSVEESEEGVCSVAVVLHSSRWPRLALNASTPASRMTEETHRFILDALSRAAEELDHMLI
jgi:DNA-binding IclR family transcriptional regulator